MRHGECRIQGDGLLQQLDRAEVLLPLPAVEHLGPKIRGVGFGVRRRRTCDPRPLLGTEPGVQRLGNPKRHVGLDREHVVEGAVCHCSDQSVRSVAVSMSSTDTRAR